MSNLLRSAGIGKVRATKDVDELRQVLNDIQIALQFTVMFYQDVPEIYKANLRALKSSLREVNRTIKKLQVVTKTQIRFFETFLEPLKQITELVGKLVLIVTLPKNKPEVDEAMCFRLSLNANKDIRPRKASEMRRKLQKIRLVNLIRGTLTGESVGTCTSTTCSIKSNCSSASMWSQRSGASSFTMWCSNNSRSTQTLESEVCYTRSNASINSLPAGVGRARSLLDECHTRSASTGQITAKNRLEVVNSANKLLFRRSESNKSFACVEALPEWQESGPSSTEQLTMARRSSSKHKARKQFVRQRAEERERRISLRQGNVMDLTAYFEKRIKELLADPVSSSGPRVQDLSMLTHAELKARYIAQTEAQAQTQDNVPITRIPPRDD